jgi:hypothetical protein
MLRIFGGDFSTRQLAHLEQQLDRSDHISQAEIRRSLTLT